MIAAGPAPAGPYGEAKREWAPKHYDMDIGIDYGKELMDVTCTVTLENITEGPLSSVPIVLYRLLKVESIEGPSGEALPFEQNVVDYGGVERQQVRFAVAKLPSAVEAGDGTKLTIRYGGHLCGQTEVYGYVHDHIDPEFTILRPDCDAYPEIGYPSWSARQGIHLLRWTYDVRLTIPDSLGVANAGRLEERTVEDGTATWRYVSRVPSWRMDFAVAPYHRVESNGNVVFCLPEDAGRGEVILDTMDRTIALYTDWWGPRRSEVGITVIEVPEHYGSQNDLAAIIQEAGPFREDKNLYLFYHELAHQWNVKSTEDFPCRIEEGLGVFIQSAVIEELEGREHLHQYMGRLISHLASRYERDPALARIPISKFGEEDATGLSYTAGALFYCILHDMAGRDTFNGMIGSFYSGYYESGADLETMLEHYREQSGADLSALYEDWIYSAKYAEYIIGGMTIDEMKALYR